MTWKAMPFALPHLSVAQAWSVLALAVAFEIAGTVSLRLSEGLTRTGPSLAIFAFYGVSFALNAMVVRVLGIGTTYAVWSGAGTIVVTFIGWRFFAESLGPLKLASVGLIVVGVIGLHVASMMAAAASGAPDGRPSPFTPLR